MNTHNRDSNERILRGLFVPHSDTEIEWQMLFNLTERPLEDTKSHKPGTAEAHGRSSLQGYPER